VCFGSFASLLTYLSMSAIRPISRIAVTVHSIDLLRPQAHVELPVAVVFSAQDGGATRYPSIAVYDADGFRKGLNPSYGLRWCSNRAPSHRLHGSGGQDGRSVTNKPMSKSRSGSNS